MPSFLTQVFPSSSHEGRVRDKVLDRLHLSVNRYGGQNEKFRQLSRYYYSLSPRLRGPDNDRPTSSRKTRYPDLFVGRSFTAIEAAVPPWVFSVVGGNPPVRVYARKFENKKQSEAVEKMLAYDWERSEVLLRSIEVAKQMFKYGTGIAQIGYKHDSYTLKRKYDVSVPDGFRKGTFETKMRNLRVHESEEITRFDGPWLEPISVFNFHPDPFANRIRDMRYVVVDRWTDKETLELENSNYEKLTGELKYKNLDRIPKMRAGYIEAMYQMDRGDDIAEAMGWNSSSPMGMNRYYQGDRAVRPQDDLVHLLEYWGRDDEHIIIANDETPIHEGQHPYDDKELPFVAARCYVLDQQFWGYGFLHTLKRPQEELNAHRNLIMRQAQLNIMNIWGYDENIGVPPELNLEPGAIMPIPTHADGKPGIVQLYEGGALPAEAYHIEDRIDADMQMINAQPSYNTGPTGADSATEATIANQNVQSRIRLQSLQGELTYATEIARFFHSRRQQFLSDDGEVFRILGKDAINYEWKKLTREDIAGEYDFIAAGQHVHATPNVQLQQIQQQLAIIGQNPMYLAVHKPFEMFRESWKLSGFPHPELFMSPPREHTLSPQAENAVLSAGEWAPVHPNDDHEQHKQIHMQAMVEARDPKAQQMFREHAAEHDKYIQLAAQSQAPQQEQPGLKGNAGNIPNLSNAVPSEASIAAGVAGGGG